MVAGCGNTCVKIILFVVNIFVCLLGGVLMSFGIWAKVNPSSFNEIFMKAGVNIDGFASIEVILWSWIVLGGLLFVFGFFGCAGAACENRCMLGMYFTFILIVLLVHIAWCLFMLFGKDIIINAYTDALNNDSTALRQAEDKLGCTDAHSCATQIYDNIMKNKTAFIIVAVVEVVILLIAMVFTCVLCQASRRERVDYTYT